MESRREVPSNKKREGYRANRGSDIVRRGEILHPEVVSFRISDDWSIDVDLSISRNGYSTMTPMEDIANALADNDMDELNSHSTRDKMRFADRLLTDVFGDVYKWVGKKRTDAYCNKEALESVPIARRKIEYMLTLLNNIEKTASMPPTNLPIPRHKRRVPDIDKR